MSAAQTVTGSPAPGVPAPEKLDGLEPTRPLDYGVINGAYGLLLGAFLAATRGKDTDPITGAELLPLGAATFALSKVVAREKIGTWVREPFVAEGRPGRPPRGRRMRHAIGELVSCTRCVGAWSALALVAIRVGSPSTGRALTSVLATSAINDFLQAAFRALCEQTRPEPDATA